MLTSYNLIDDEKATKKKKQRQEDLRILSFSGFNLTDVCLVFKINTNIRAKNIDEVQSVSFGNYWSSDYFFQLQKYLQGKSQLRKLSQFDWFAANLHSFKLWQFKIFKVRIFLEGHKNLVHLTLFFNVTQLRQIKRGGLAKYLNFIPV